jgi:tetratricopeptide (TPR) repeat protein
VTPERWAEVGRVFDAAHELPLEGRASFLNGLEDAELRSEVESLLTALDGRESFLERPEAERFHAAAPKRVGPYEVLREIGRGGMGVVYEAIRRDQGFERSVAIKVVKRGMDTDFILRRFESERRILGSLDHLNIARVLDGGSTEDGLPYFVMELIEGEGVLAYCARRELGVRERLELFRRVCSAVQYAHQRLVIHRDIKPANILVGAYGVPKLLDFGLAKVLAREAGETVDRTETALRILTPEYASPEQVGGEELTTSSDVYSLGVVLYELLTGKRPRDPRDPEREPARPSTRARLHRDLDAIVLTALRREPARRYASAEQLSEDIRRHLEGLPVRAAPDSFGYRAGKFVRRHKLELAAAALVVAALAGGLAASLVQMRVARLERDRAAVAAARANEVSTFLKSLFQASSPQRAQGAKLSAQDLLDAGAARVEKELHGQPEVEAAMLEVLGSVYSEMGLQEKAEPLLTRSLSLRERVLGANDPDVAASLLALGRLKEAKADYPSARALLTRAVRIREARAPAPELAQALNQLGTTFWHLGDVERAGSLMRRAIAVEERTGGKNLHSWLMNLSAVEIHRDDLPSARALLTRAIDLAERTSGKADVQVDVALANLSDVLRADEDYAGAARLLEQALAIDEKAYGAEHVSVAYMLGELGDVLCSMGERARGVDLLDRSLRVAEHAVGPEHPALASPLEYKGRALLADGKPNEAMPLFQRAHAILTKSFAEGDVAAVGEALVDIAGAEVRISGPAVAEATLRRALAIQRKSLVAGHRALIPTLTALGRVLLEEGRASEARPLFAEAVELARAKQPERHSQRVAAEKGLAEAERKLRRRA